MEQNLHDFFKQSLNERYAWCTAVLVDATNWNKMSSRKYNEEVNNKFKNYTLWPLTIKFD